MTEASAECRTMRNTVESAPMRRLLASTLLLTTTLFAQTPPAPIYGFADPAKQQALEAKFDASLSRANLEAWMKQLAARPHHAGSRVRKGERGVHRRRCSSRGVMRRPSSVSTCSFPTPKTRVVELIAPERYTAKLAEPALAEDATSSQTGEICRPTTPTRPTATSPAELVYVNYGMPKDYEVLERNGIDVQGKIVIARYGGSWRGIKPKVAAEHGAIGCLIYSDPRDDGYFQGDVYPKGAFRSDQCAQRGSVPTCRSIRAIR